jgi:hypothetical protein
MSTTETITATCHEAFEAWARGRYDLETHKADRPESLYTHADTARAYSIWRAAWEARGNS